MEWIKLFHSYNYSHSRDLYFQQDGFPAHYSRAVWKYFDERFPGKLIGRRCPIDWPVRLPELTTTDFFLLESTQDKVYSRKPRSFGDLKNYIREAFQKINEQSDLCKNDCQRVRSRLQSYVNCERQQLPWQNFSAIVSLSTMKSTCQYNNCISAYNCFRNHKINVIIYCPPTFGPPCVL